MPDIIDIIRNANTEQRGKFDIKSILSSVGFSLGVSIVLLLAFSVLRPRNTVVYAPKVKYADEKHQPPRLRDTPWAWIRPILTLREDALVDKVGLDAIIYLRFLRMCRNYLALVSILGAGAIIPINIIGTNQTAKSSSDSTGSLNPLLRLTVSGLTGNWIIPHIAFSYVFLAILLVFIWFNYRRVCRLRQRYFASDEYQSALASRTLMMIDLPSRDRSDDTLARRAMSLKRPEPFSQAQVGRDVGKLPVLIDKHEDAVRELESVLAKYLKNPHKPPANRPLKHGRDAIDLLTHRVQSLEQQISAARESYESLGMKQYGFVSYSSIPAAHRVAKANKTNHDVFLAPRPNDILWRNVATAQSKRNANKFFGNLLFVALCILWTVPNALIATFISNIYNLGAVWPWFQSRINQHPTLWAVIQGVAAPILLALFFLILPSLMRRITQFEGALTKSARERTVFHKLFLFFFINNFVIFTLFGVIWNFVQSTVIVSAQQSAGFSGFWDALRNSYFLLGLTNAVTSTSTFWIIYVAQRNLGCLLDLVQVFSLLQKWFKRTFMSPTPREMIEWSAPIPFDYASYYNTFLFNFTIVLSYATLAPLILPFGFLYFVVSGVSYKYALLYVNVTKVESGGSFWRILVNRLLLVSGFSNLVLFVIVWAKTTVFTAIAVLPALVIIVAFKLYLLKFVEPRFAYIELESGSDDTGAPIVRRSDQKRDRLRSRFGHPALSHTLIVPMVHERSRHLLKEVYRGRLSDADMESTPINHVEEHFEVVPENALNFDQFKLRPEFAEEHGDIYSVADTADDTTISHQESQARRPSARPYQSYMSDGSTLGLAMHNHEEAYEMGSFSRQRDGSQEDLAHLLPLSSSTRLTPRRRSVEQVGPISWPDTQLLPEEQISQQTLQIGPAPYHERRSGLDERDASLYSTAYRPPSRR
ncbi:hypothetical protein PYCC9005_002755 [Savitreella phatthalungensis]